MSDDDKRQHDAAADDDQDEALPDLDAQFEGLDFAEQLAHETRPMEAPEEIEERPESLPEEPPPGHEDRFPPVAPSLATDGEAPETLPATEPGRPGRFARTDIIAVFFLLASVAMCAYYVTIWNDPFSPLNPLAPPTPFVVITTTPDRAAFPPPTARPTDPAPSAGTDSPYPFALVDTVYTPNDNGRGCNWASIAGSVTDLDGAPLSGYGVQITGGDPGDPLDEKVFSGSAQTYGPGGFELPLGGAPVAETFTLRLVTPQGTPVSDDYTLTTHDDCDENVAVVTFVQQRPLE